MFKNELSGQRTCVCRKYLGVKIVSEIIKGINPLPAIGRLCVMEIISTKLAGWMHHFQVVDHVFCNPVPFCSANRDYF